MEQVYNKFCRKIQKKFGDYKKVCAFAIPFEGYAKKLSWQTPTLARLGSQVRVSFSDPKESAEMMSSVLHAAEGGSVEESAVGHAEFFVGSIIERHEVVVLDVLEAAVGVGLDLMHCGTDAI